MNRENTFLHWLFFIWISLILAIGWWWLYLILKLSDDLKVLYQYRPELNRGTDFGQLVVWEGGAFFVLLLLASFSLAFFYYRDQKKTKSLQAFFASLTHELKTPLASIKLQSQVIREKVKSTDDNDLYVLTSRLEEDNERLENQLENILQLSRIERGGEYSRDPVSLRDLVMAVANNYLPKLSVAFVGENSTVLGDEYALKIIFRNLFENTLRHREQSKNDKEVILSIVEKGPEMLVEYNDQGDAFLGDMAKLGQLFYKFKSKNGAGIGLYLINKLCRANNGRFDITNHPNLKFQMVFKKYLGQINEEH